MARKNNDMARKNKYSEQNVILTILSLQALLFF